MQHEPRPWKLGSSEKAMEKRLTTLEATVRELSTMVESKSSPERKTVADSPSETEVRTDEEARSAWAYADWSYLSGLQPPKG